VIDLPAAVDTRGGRRLGAILAGGAEEDQIAVRGLGPGEIDLPAYRPFPFRVRRDLLRLSSERDDALQRAL